MLGFVAARINYLGFEGMTNPCSVELFIASAVLDGMKDLEDAVLDKLFLNFIKPLKYGYTADELEGKYKPSWEIPFGNTCPMREALADFARKNAQYHYHFGYPYYQTGNDPKYSGKESDGIVHTVFLTSSDQETTYSEIHTIFRIDPSHPHPFTVPTNLNQPITRFP